MNRFEICTETYMVSGFSAGIANKYDVNDVNRMCRRRQCRMEVKKEDKYCEAKQRRRAISAAMLQNRGRVFVLAVTEYMIMKTNGG